MIVLVLCIMGLFSFLLGVGFLGMRLRRHPTKENAEAYSRIAHFMFFACLVGPTTILIIYPGFRHLDELVGLAPLPLRLLFLVVGIVAALAGLYLLGITNRSLRALGSGANAFRLTKRVVETRVYQHTRNPMSLGYYLFSLGAGFISGSTLLTLGVLLGLIPAHLFFLKYLEEFELELRFGAPYLEYKKKTPFLIPRPWK